jgi:tetratricopeptide (TPR) repeat protein
MLEYGIEKSSQIKTETAAAARAQFETTLGETYCSMLNWNAAISVLEDALRHKQQILGSHNRRGTLSSVYKMLGHAYMSIGRYDDALIAFTNFSDGEDGEFYNIAVRTEIAEVYLLTAQYPKALKEYKTALQLFDAWVLKRKTLDPGAGDFDDDIGTAWLNLGCVYDRISRPDQAKSCFSKAIPHFVYECEKAESERNGSPQDSLYRSEGRINTSLAWLYERVDPTDQRAEEHYAKAVWVFDTAIWEEDDFLEEDECVLAKNDLERARNKEKWVFPGEEEDRERRERARAWKYRINWGVKLPRKKKTRRGEGGFG